MSHELDQSRSLSYVGNKAANPWWRGMAGTVEVSEEMSGDVASRVLRERLFNYKVEARRLVSGGVEVETHKALWEVDPKARIRRRLIPGAVVGKGYRIVQPQVVVNFGDALARTGEAQWHTAGILKGGARVWGLAKIGEQFDIGTERIQDFLLFWNTFDGSSKFLCRRTPVCVVCWNTAEMALRGDGTTLAAIQHSGDVEGKLEDALALLQVTERQQQQQRDTIRALQDTPLDVPRFADFVAQWLSGKDDVEEAREVVATSQGRSRTLYEAKGTELLRLWHEGKGAAERRDTQWRAYNAVTEYIDWQRGRMANYRRLASQLTPEGLDSAWWGDGAQKKRRALKLLRGGGVER